MSWTDEEIDKLFQDGANAQSFEYDNSYFTEMEAAALPVNKKGKDFLWMGTALLFIAVLTTGYFANEANDNVFNGTNDQLAKSELNNESTVDSKTSMKDQPSTNVLMQDQQDNESTNENLTSEEGMDVASAKSNSTNHPNSRYAPSQEEGSSKSMYNVDASGKTTTAKGLAVTKATGSVVPKVIDEQDPKIKQLINLRADTKINNQRQFDVDRVPITAGLIIKSLKQLDQGIDCSLIPNTLPALSSLRPKSTFYVEFNAGVSQSLITPSEYTSNSYGGGFGVESYLGNFNLTTGLNFKLSEHNDLFFTRSAKFYGFGSTFDTDTYDYRKVYSIELPISLGYNFGNHNVNIGVRPSILIGAKVKHQSFEDEELTRSEELYGLAGGLTRYGLKPTFGYSYHMNKWTIGANIGVQLMQSIDEDFIDGFNNRFPVDGQIYLRRTIRLRK
ncbi:MAG: hypothetical protein COA38_12955 [Fluviicola sp.]|nr:MAG: hypothetical protein COA38_12955 [Fluviicola sp.]